MKKSLGDPRKLNSEQEKNLINIIINNTPDKVGFKSEKNWIIELA